MDKAIEKIVEYNTTKFLGFELNRFDQNNMVILADDRAPKIYDLEKGVYSWKGKNVKADELQLKVPMYDLAADFVDNGNGLFVVNGNAKVRFFDLKAVQKRPTIDHTITREFRTRALGSVIARNDNIIVTANYEGTIFVMDRRQDCKEIGKFTSAHGAITDLAFDKDRKILTSVCADRYMRFYNLDTMKDIKSVYMTQKLSKVRFTDQAVSVGDFEFQGLEDTITEEKGHDDLVAMEPKKKTKAKIFRDYLEDEGGNLDHNLVKLNYEHRHQPKKVKEE